LQLGWLEATRGDEIDRPVFMDGRRGGIQGKCALFTVADGKRIYLSSVFDADPVLFLTSDFFINALNYKGLRNRFRYLSEPQTDLQTRIFGEDKLKPPHKGEVRTGLDRSGWCEATALNHHLYL